MYAAATPSAVPVQVALLRPIRWDSPSHGEMERHIRNSASSEDDVILSRHAAQDRLSQRGFSKADVLDILSHGQAYKLEAGSRPGEWKVNLARKVRGRDAAVCAAVSPKSGTIYVLTVMWLDRPI